jgi:hypothetical protein
VHDLLVLLGPALPVVDVPAKGLGGGDELDAALGLVVVGAAALVLVAAVAVDEVVDRRARVSSGTGTGLRSPSSAIPALQALSSTHGHSRRTECVVLHGIAR